MTLKRGYAEHGDNIILTLSRDDYEALLLALGKAGGLAMQQRDRTAFLESLRVANRINEGNPRWTPYDIEGHV